MQITGLKQQVSQADILKVLRTHLGDKQTNLLDLSKQISEGYVINLDYDWALEQDLKDLGVRVK
jgi:hypothetical protein